MSEPLTPEAYVRTHGSKCPACHSDQIVGHSVDFDMGYVMQRVGCEDCNAEWWDTYELTGYEDLTIPAKDNT